jgi:hypothetical protein
MNHPEGGAFVHTAETRQYLRDFNRLNEATVNARQLYDAMLELYPDRWWSYCLARYSSSSVDWSIS